MWKCLSTAWTFLRFMKYVVCCSFVMRQAHWTSISKTWNWSERFPGYEELRRYFQHVAKVLKLEDLIDFDHEVIEASYSDETNKWTVKSRSGDTATCKYLVTAVGTSFASCELFGPIPYSCLTLSI